MDNIEIYLDNNATTPTLPQVRDEMLRVLEDCYGNPSSTHYAGERSRRALWQARENVAGIIGSDAGDLYFTSGGTEANNLALLWVLSLENRRRIITTSIEHSSVLKTCDFLTTKDVEVVLIDPEPTGRIEPRRVADELERAPTSLVSIQWVNNETGVIQPVEMVGRLCRNYGVTFHTDAAQAVGKIPISVAGSEIDILTMTAHKIHGPQGIGAIFIRDPKIVRPRFFGGPQESSLRPGTENLVGIAGFSAAVKLRSENMSTILPQISTLRDNFENRLLRTVSGVVANGDPRYRVCNTTNLMFTGVDGQAMVAQLDAEGIRCSQSSACTNQRPEPSYVLQAMGLSENKAYESVRFSFSELNTAAEVETAVQAICDISGRLRTFSQNQHELVHERIAP